MQKIKNISLARGLRHSQTDAERLLWSKLRNNQLDGVKFRRQQPVGNYIADFICFDRKLVIEIDGGQHNKSPRNMKDNERTKWFEHEGFHVIRLWNTDVLQNMENVYIKIQEALNEFSPSLSLSHQGRGMKVLSNTRREVKPL